MERNQHRIKTYTKSSVALIISLWHAWLVFQIARELQEKLMALGVRSHDG